MSGRDGKAQFSEGLDPASALCPTEDGPTECAHAVICKSAAAAAAAAGGLSCIERGPVREFPSAKSSESQFLSSRKRSNIVPRATATDLPSPLALRRRCRSIRDRCRASSAGPSPRPRSARHPTGTSWYNRCCGRRCNPPAVQTEHNLRGPRRDYLELFVDRAPSPPRPDGQGGRVNANGLRLYV